MCAHLKSEVNAVLMAIRLAFFVIKLENVHEYKLFLFYSFGKIARKEWLLTPRSAANFERSGKFVRQQRLVMFFSTNQHCLSHIGQSLFLRSLFLCMN